MDTSGARHLKARLAIGAAVGERVEVVSVRGDDPGVEPGERGTVLSIDDNAALVLFDLGAELEIDPFVVRLRRVRDSL